MMPGLSITILLGLLGVLGEVLHARRCRRVNRLAFGPAGRSHEWTKVAPLLRVAALAMLAWGLVELWRLVPQARSLDLSTVPDRHLVIAWDVSPSMKLKDAGVERRMTRAQRGAEAAYSILERADLSRLRMSVVAFYTEAKSVVVDTADLAVVRNILDGLPLELAFSPGQTKLLDGVRMAAELAKNWPADSTTLLIISDGDTMPDQGLNHLPPSVKDVLVLGLGSQAGVSIDGHLSRQDSSTLRQLAARLSGHYFDANERNLPSKQLAMLARSLPPREDRSPGRREWVLAAIACGAAILALLPLALARAGSAWKPDLLSTRSRPTRTLSRVASTTM